MCIIGAWTVLKFRVMSTMINIGWYCQNTLIQAARPVKNVLKKIGFSETTQKKKAESIDIDNAKNRRKLGGV